MKRTNLRRSMERNEILRQARRDRSHLEGAPAVPGSFSGYILETMGPLQPVFVCEICNTHVEGENLLILHKQANH